MSRLNDERARDSGDDAKSGDGHALADHHQQDPARRRAERDPDAQLPRWPG